MAHTYSTHNDLLLRWARTCLEHGVRHGVAPPIDMSAFPTELHAPRAVFITLEKNGRLRGCIGHLEATQPLINDIAENTVAAAKDDPRFSPVKAGELPHIVLSISILTPPEPMHIRSEQDLLNQLRPGVDGLILGEGRRRATFLPSVWDELPEPRDFVMHLKLKAGWSPDYWSEKITAQRYQSIYLSEKGEHAPTKTPD